VRTESGRRLADRLLWIGLGRKPRVEQDLPTIVVEFVSEARRDRERDYATKRQEYLQAGVQEYWIVDRFQRKMTVVRQQGEQVIEESESYLPALLPGFELPLARLLAVGDSYNHQPRRPSMNHMMQPPIPVLGLEMAGTLMTPEEFDAVTEYDEDYFYELIHGVLIVTPPPLDAEVDPNDELGRLLRNYQFDHPQGSALNLTLPERNVITPTSRRRADRLIWAGLGRRPNTRQDVPTITIEFVSRARRDRHRDYVEKRQEYLAVGVQEYWIIDRFQRIMTVIRPQSEEVIAETEVYRPTLLPGFELPLSRLLGLADLNP